MTYTELNGKLHKEKQGRNWTYILEEEDEFDPIGYKFLESSASTGQEGVLSCAKIRYNGQSKLIYLTENYVTLPAILATVPMSSVWTIFYKLLSAVLKIRENWFISCMNLDISPECIYFDPKTQEPYLIYIPIDPKLHEENVPEFEAALRRSMIQALRASNNVMLQDREAAMLDILTDNAGGLQGLMREIMKNIGGTAGSVGSKELILVCKSHSVPGVPKTIEVDKEQYTIGRSVNNDCVIDKKSISRKHCSIVKENNSFKVVDEDSTYGTYVNGSKCIPGKKNNLNDRDILRLDKLEFEVRIQVK